MKIPKLALYLCLAIGLLTVTPITGHAQVPKDLVGTWSLVSAVSEQGSSKTMLYGEKPKGVLNFDATGHFSIIYVADGLPKFASNSRTTGTPEENKAVVQGSLSYFGTYTANEAGKSMTYHLDASTFPNWTGADQKRTFALAGDQLTIINNAPSGGSGVVTLVYQRVK